YDSVNCVKLRRTNGRRNFLASRRSPSQCTRSRRIKRKKEFCTPSSRQLWLEYELPPREQTLDHFREDDLGPRATGSPPRPPSRRESQCLEIDSVFVCVISAEVLCRKLCRCVGRLGVSTFNFVYEILRNRDCPFEHPSRINR